MSTKRTRDMMGTHSGSFHADESLGVALLRSLPQFSTHELVRTRDPAKLAECAIVLDVGGTYDHEANRYDHHQRGFEEVFGQGFVTKLSSAGLIYKLAHPSSLDKDQYAEANSRCVDTRHFGLEIIAHKLSLPISHPSVQTLHVKLYADFVEALDGIDNGISAYTGPAKYRSRTDLSSRVGSLNPRWNETSNDEILDARFETASALAGSEFFSALDYAANAWLPAREIIVKALNERKQVHPSGSIVVFSEFAPWKVSFYLSSSFSVFPSG